MITFKSTQAAGANCSAMEQRPFQKRNEFKNLYDRAIKRVLTFFVLLLIYGANICVFGQGAIPKYDKVREFQGGITAVQLNGYWGCIDNTGTLIVPIIHLWANDAVDDVKRRRAEISDAEKMAALEREKTEQKGGVTFVFKEQTIIPFSYFLQDYVVQEMNKWLQKGEFEKTADWELRISDNNRKAKTDELLKEAEHTYIAKYGKNLPIGSMTLGEYDADNERFLIRNNIHGDFFVPVPINDAPNFKNNWERLIRPQYAIINDQIAVAGFNFVPIGAVGVAVANNNVSEQKENQPQTKYNPVQPEVAANIPKTNNNNNASTQKGKISIGLSPSIYMGGDIFLFGLCGKFQVGIANPIRLEGSFEYHFPKTIESYVKLSMWDVNLNMHPIFTKDDRFLLYSLIGLRISGIKASAPGVSGKNDPFFGLNFGAGFDVKLSKKLFFNLESKYMLSFIEGKAGHGFSVSAGFIVRF